MAHPHQLKFVEITSRFFKLHTPSLSILEVGSYIVNGSVRPFFGGGASYTGVDLIAGPGVDLVSDGEKIDLPSESFDVTISCECFEHNPHWVKTFENMHRMTKKSGLMIVSCASRGRLEHGTKRTSPESSPGTQSVEWNYYRNLNKKDFVTSLNLNSMFYKYVFLYNGESKDLYFVGEKRGDNNSSSSWSASELESVLNRVNQELPKSTTPKFMKFMWSITRLPLYFASFLPDEVYQNFALPYSQFNLKMREALGKFVGH